MKIKARLLSVILTLAMAVSLIPAVTLPASAADLTVVDKGIYTNGNPVIIAGGSSGTLIYDDADADGQIDETETPIALSGPSGDNTSGYDLSLYNIYGTAASGSVLSSKITMLGGQVSYIFGSGENSGVNVIGDTDITFKGGTAALLYGGGNNGSVGGNTNVTVTGGTISDSIVGGCGAGTVSGSANVTITGGTIKSNVYGGGWGGSVTGAATVTVGVDASITGTVTSACSYSGTVGPESKVIYEVAFYDASGGSKYDSDSLLYPPQWIESGDAATKPATDPTQTGKSFSGWEKVSDDSAYDFTAAVSAAVKLYPGWLSTDATLNAASTTVKGQTVTGIGTPSGTFGSETAGSVTITATQAADTSNTGSFITLFNRNDANADVKAVKYASGAPTASFADDTAYADETITNNDFFIVKVTAQDSATVNYYRINVTVTTAPTVTATGGTPTFTQGDLNSVDLFSSVTAAANDVGKTFSGATLTVTNISETAEYLTIGGTDIALTDSASGTFTGGSYSVAMPGTTATVTLSGMALDNTAMGTLIDDITYKNSAASVTAGNRVITLTSVTHSGSGDNSTTLSIASTVTVTRPSMVYTPVNGETFTCVSGDTITIGAGRSVTLNGNSAQLTNVRIICEANATLTLQNVVISNSGYSGVCPLTFTGAGGKLILESGTTSTLTGGASAPGVSVAALAGLTLKNDGTLTVTGGSRCAGLQCPEGATLTMSGNGTTNATGGAGGAGIGGGFELKSGTMTFSSGDVKAMGVGIILVRGGIPHAGAGIGGGAHAACGNITISGGIITATGYSTIHQYGFAGIGGADITIVGGTVAAKGYLGSAGIGDNSNSGSTITIMGGTVNATGGSYSMGIGSGNVLSTASSAPKVTIEGGTVYATGGTWGGAGIGGALGVSGGEIEISGGTVYAEGGGVYNSSSPKDIGPGAGGTDGTLTIFGTAEVFLKNNSCTTPTTTTHTNSTYSTGTTEVYGAAISVPGTWTTVFGAYLRPCTLAYDANGGSGTAPDSVTRLYNTEITLASGSELSLANYHFDGWNASADGTGTNYAAGSTYTIKANTTFYAKWVGNTYTVTYNPNSGTVTQTSQVKLYGSTYGKDKDGNAAAMPTPAWAGHIFSGWYTAASGGTKVTDSDTVSIIENTTLYAVWKAGQPSAPEISGKTDTTVTVSSVAGLEYSIDGTNWQSGNVFSGLSANTAYTVYCRVAAVGNDLASDASGGTSVTTKQSAPAAPDKPVLVSKTDTNITVAGISGAEYSKDGGSSWQSGNVFSGLNAGTVYSICARIKETDTVMPGSSSGALSVTTKTSTATAPAAPTATEQTYNSITISTVTGQQYAITTASTEPTTWDSAVTASGTKAFNSLSPATQYYIWTRTAETDAAMPSGASSIAVYTAKSTPVTGEGYTIDYSAETISITDGYEVTADNSAPEISFLSSGGSISSVIASSAQKIYVRAKADVSDAPASVWAEVTIPARPSMPSVGKTDETIDGKNDGTITGAAASMEYRLSTDSEWTAVSAEQAAAAITGLSDGTYYIRYSAMSATAFASYPQTLTIAPGYTITVTFDSCGGSDVESITGFTYGGNLTEPSAPSRSGYYFAGWYREPTYSNSWTFSVDTLSDNIILYAKWNAVPTYTVTGCLVDGTSEMAIVQGATIKIIQGVLQFGTTGVTDEHGDFSIEHVPTGIYNLVITKESKTVVVIIAVSSDNLTVGNVVLPSVNANSTLIIQGSDTPNVVVGRLDTEALAQLGAGSSVSLVLIVEEKNEAESTNGAAVAEASENAGLTMGIILEVDLSKSVNGAEPTALSESSELIEIIIPIPQALQNNSTYSVFRYHGTLVDRITETSNSENERIEVDRSNWTIRLYAKKFSTYAIAYANYYSSSAYTITSSSSEGGSIAPNGHVSVYKGNSETFAITPDNGYYISDVLVDGASIGAVGSYTFSNVTSSHTIRAAFAKAEGLPYYLDAGGNKVFIGFASNKSGIMKYIAPEGKTIRFTENAKNFTDISGHWAKPYITFAAEREIFVSMGGNLFSPDTGMTRAMFATIIGRLYERSYGEIEALSDHAFTDCDYDDYYGKYVDWAAKNSILGGYGNGMFDPDGPVIREQMAAILYRFADFLGVLPDDMDTALNYSDAGTISSWAESAALYCQSTGIITGRDDGMFTPEGTATRAEVAAIIERFVESVIA